MDHINFDDLLKNIIIFYMLVDCNHNLIAAWYTIDEVLPYKQYQSGAKDKEKTIYMYPTDEVSNPILTLEFDILNKDGYGLKRGYYEIGTDKEYSYLMFIESGYIKAKIPVIKHELIDRAGTDFEWEKDKPKNTPRSASKNFDDQITVASRRVYKYPYSEKELKKRKKKYKKGQDPTTYFHSKAYMEYDDEIKAYKVIWEKYNTRLIGVIKI